MTDELRRLIGQIPDHPSLVPVIDAGVTDGRAFILTPLLTGDSLDAALAAYGPAAFVDALPRLHNLAEALDRAAAAGLWHGALTPRHVVVGAEETQLLEVGVAQALWRAGEQVNLIRPYRAPEILGGEPGSPAADQYSLAAIAHEWLFGRPVDEPAMTGLAVPHLPGLNVRTLRAALTTALAAQPSDRHPSCTAFVNALGNAKRSKVEAVAELPLLDVADEPLSELEPLKEAAPADFPVGPMQYDQLVEESPTVIDTPPRSTHFGLGALATALAVGVVIGVAAMWTWMSQPPPPSSEVATREFTDAPVVAARSAEHAPPADTTSAARLKAVPAPADAAAAVPNANGSLLVRSTPAGATVTVNSVARGVTPLSLRSLDFGLHTVVVSRPGYTPAERQVTLTQQRPSRSIDVGLTSGSARLAAPARGAPTVSTGTLLIESRPAGAVVTVDGRHAGVTPLTTAMAQGRHSVRIDRPGYRPWTTTIDVAAGERARVAASLVGGQEEQ